MFLRALPLYTVINPRGTQKFVKWEVSERRSMG